MRRRLPSLRSLLAFEAVIRCGGVSAAAEDLGVTHGAVSKQIAGLEEWFGRPLLDRGGARPVPVADAAEFARTLGACFDEIARGARRLSADGPARLLVLAPATVALRWLVPRLSRFRTLHPDVEVCVQTTHTTDDWRAFPADLVIRRGMEAVPGWTAVPFLDESITLVGAPEPVRHLAGDPEAVPDSVLLSSASRPMELERWLEAAGLGRRPVPRRMVSNHFYVALEAALNGMGLIAAPVPVVAGEIAAGRLAVPFPHIRVPGPTVVALYDPAGGAAEHAAVFAQWLCAEGRGAADGA
ncbi:LysR substrate-binding domain-containing protein [Azospirillum halopraeferens]|uniref:LysR substrate-binding domain-containing protein n=1 Tax=Azospirillum halopraeferens TaxID=34010 RepID=UPI0004161606|nr:LysR substrate-binding domain-containing protein [Azospirillum halopraeferens]